jgi:hypothetical protein
MKKCSDFGVLCFSVISKKSAESTSSRLTNGPRRDTSDGGYSERVVWDTRSPISDVVSRRVRLAPDNGFGELQHLT